MSVKIAGSSLLFAILSWHACAGQTIRFPAIEQRYDAVVLLADARSGRLLGGARMGEANDRNNYPGSLFKLAIGIAALRSGKFDRTFTYTCSGKDTIAGAAQACWLHDGHATIGFSDALAVSCNLYFRRIARTLSREEIIQGARGIGMLPAAVGGGDPFSNLNDETLLGEAFPVSPAGMLNVALALASRGRIGAGGISLFGARFRPLYDGMRECVRIGTGKGAWTSRFSIAGKTGTSENGIARSHTGWFIGFAPADRPKYAVVVMCRNAHGSEAAAIARQALEKVM
ncbi:MAG: penicillin-binding transpeptidase domain-containing protein [Candidatus Kapaibacterium sp.]